MALGLVQACLVKQCHEIGCQSGAKISISSVGRADIRTVRACLEGDCTEVSWTADAVCVDTNGESPNLSLCLADSDSLDLWVFENEGRNGDVLSVRIEGEGAVLLDEERVLQYADRYPNGKDCPGHCRVATVEL